MKISCRLVLLLMICLGLQTFGHEAGAASSSAAPLVGAWKLVTPALDAAGQPCPFVPEGIDVSGDGTASLTNMPGGRLPYKTEVTAEETQAILARNPGLKGMALLLMKPVPQMDWQATPMVYGYKVSKNELTLVVPGWSPAKYRRVK